MQLLLLLLLSSILFSHGVNVRILKEGVRRPMAPPPILFTHKKDLIRVVPSVGLIEIWRMDNLKEKDRKAFGTKIRTAIKRGDYLIIAFYDGTVDIYDLKSWKKIKSFRGIFLKRIPALMNSCNSCMDFYKDKLIYVDEEGIVMGNTKIRGNYNGVVVHEGKLYAGGKGGIDIFDLGTGNKKGRINMEGDVIFIYSYPPYIVADTTSGVFLIDKDKKIKVVGKDFGFIGRAFRYIRFPVRVEGSRVIYPEIVRFGKFVLGIEYYIRIKDLLSGRTLCNHKVLINDSSGFPADLFIYKGGSIIYSRIDGEFLKVKCGGE